MSFGSFHDDHKQRIDEFLDKLLTLNHIISNETAPLLEAMRYSVLNGGKRIRPLLVYATGEALGNPPETLDASAAAIELIHCYSLVHDDLPAMDNDEIRRGKPTCHKAFDEGTAILVGDALQALAFQVLSDPALNPAPPQQKVKMIYALAKTSGWEGMVGGQALDLQFEDSDQIISLEQLRELHRKKTGSLIEASVTLAALASLDEVQCEQQLTKLQEFARCIGLAFQIQDDILDVIGNVENLGKSIGKDQQQRKASFPSRLGIETAKQYADVLRQQAQDALQFLHGKRDNLIHLCDMLVLRSN